MKSIWCHKKRVNAKRPNCYSNNALPVPTPVLTGSGSLGPSLKRSQAVKPPQGVLILQSSAHHTMKFRNPLVEVDEMMLCWITLTQRKTPLSFDRGVLFWWWRRDLNPRPQHYECCALTNWATSPDKPFKFFSTLKPALKTVRFQQVGNFSVFEVNCQRNCGVITMFLNAAKNHKILGKSAQTVHLLGKRI